MRTMNAAIESITELGKNYNVRLHELNIEPTTNGLLEIITRLRQAYIARLHELHTELTAIHVAERECLPTNENKIIARYVLIFVLALISISVTVRTAVFLSMSDH